MVREPKRTGRPGGHRSEGESRALRVLGAIERQATELQSKASGVTRLSRARLVFKMGLRLRATVGRWSQGACLDWTLIEVIMGRQRIVQRESKHNYSEVGG